MASPYQHIDNMVLGLRDKDFNNTLDYSFENSLRGSLVAVPNDDLPVGHDAAPSRPTEDAKPYTNRVDADGSTCLLSFPKEHAVFEDIQYWDWSTLYGGEMSSTTCAYMSTFAGDESNSSDMLHTVTQNKIITTVPSGVESIEPLYVPFLRAPETVRLPDQQASSLTPTSPDDDSDDIAEVAEPNIVIGLILSNGKFKCRESRCHRRSYGRVAELRRHYDVAHAPTKPAFWCPVTACERSQGIGGRCFPRKDKLRSHLRSVHGGYRHAVDFEAKTM